MPGALKFKLQFVLIVCLLLAGCNSTPVVQEIDQAQANQIVAVLNHSGISAFASKENGAKGRFTVEVKRGDYAQAVTILNEKGLPAETKASFNELVSQSGLIPNSRELDSLKVDRALATDIEEMLSNHPEIASSRVIVRSSFVKENQEPAVTLMIQAKPGKAVLRGELIDSVARVIPGIKPDNIVLMLHDAEPEDGLYISEGASNQGGKVVRVPLTPFLIFWRVPEDEYPQIAAVLGLFLLVVGGIGAVVGYWYRMYQHSQDYFENSLPEVVQNRGARAERTRNLLGKFDSDGEEGPQ